MHETDLFANYAFAKCNVWRESDRCQFRGMIGARKQEPRHGKVTLQTFYTETGATGLDARDVG